MHWRVERDGRTIELAVTPNVVRDGGKTIGRVEVVPGQPPEMVTVRYGLFEGLSQAVLARRGR